MRQDVFQAAISTDDFIGPFRLESGANYQLSRTAGALTGRLTQDLVDNGRYIRGSPLVNLDLNGNGVIGYLEMQNAFSGGGQAERWQSAADPVLRLATGRERQATAVE